MPSVRFDMVQQTFFGRNTAMRTLSQITFAILFGGTVSATAQMNHADHTAGTAHGDRAAARLETASTMTEPGQGAFASLPEVVQLLEADPKTDWATVNLSGLRDHLVDMDRLVTGSRVVDVVLANGLKMTATGVGRTVATLQRMVPAHAHQLAKDERWVAVAETVDARAILTVTSADPEVAARIKGLGFFGLMASQDHHREHHLLMARGDDVHVH